MLIKTITCGRFRLNLDRPLIMGILNFTPDSFSDGGKFFSIKKAVDQTDLLIEQGADIVDIGAESTRPNAKPITAKEEIARLTPLVKLLVDKNIPISIDTRHSETMHAMLDLGVDMINDISGFSDINAWRIVSGYQCALCIMHMRGNPVNMQNQTNYVNLVDEIVDYLKKKVNQASDFDINQDRIVLDPGFGFAKTPLQNMQLINQIAKFSLNSYPVLLGASRKSTIGYFLNNNVEERLIGSVVLAAIAVFQGASIVRVHDVKPTKEALILVENLKPQNTPPTKSTT